MATLDQHHRRRAMVAFAPSKESLVAEIDEAANAPTTPKIFRKEIEPVEVTKPKVQAASPKRLQFSVDHGSTSTRHGRPGKNPLPRPYRKHWAEIQSRNANRDFIYGKDEEIEFTERDSRVKTPCCGVICFHALELLDLVVNKQSFIEHVPISYYCLLTVGSIKRCTKIVHALDPRQIKMDYFLHLSVDISEWREAPNNKLRIELWSFQDPEAHYIVGTVEIHIYNFIRIQHSIDTIFLWSDGLKVGKLAYEVAFSYGSLGYGHSNQLKNFSQPIMETISHSMFPRIKLDDKADVADLTFQARMPDELKLFTYHSLILEVDETDTARGAFFKNTGKHHRFNRIDLEPKRMVVQQVEFDQGFPVHCKLHMNIWQKVLQPDFNDMYGEFVCLGHKRERLDYLANLVQGRMRDIYEEEASPIYEYLKPKDLDHINRTDNLPAEVIFPKKVPCPTSEPYTIDIEDEHFQDKFPSARRESGYLSTIFGLDGGRGGDGDGGGELAAPTEKEMVDNDIVDDMAYLKTHRMSVIQNHSKKPFKLKFKDWTEHQYIEWKAYFLRKFSFLFPDVSQRIIEVPEISLTIATPEGSTTNIYSYFSREIKDPNSTNSKVDRLVKNTTALIDMTRKTQAQKKGKYKNSSDSSTTTSSDDDEAVLQQSIKNTSQPP